MKPDDPPIIPVNSPAKEENGTKYTIFAATQQSIERWEDRLQRYLEKQKDWEDRHDKEVKRIFLNYSTEPRMHIKNALAMCNKLKMLYNFISLAISDSAYL